MTHNARYSSETVSSLNQRLQAFFAILLTLSYVYPAQAHEFWIEPANQTLKSGDNIQAALRNGEHFQGVEIPHIPDTYRDFYLYDQLARYNIKSDVGSMPAINESASRSALHIALYHSTDHVASYDSLDDLETFASEEDLNWILSEHQRHGFPDNNIAEIYTRYAKALIAVGTAEGTDAYFGMKLELVALSNPYHPEQRDSVKFQLLFEGAPLADTQVSVFYKTNPGELADSSTNPMLFRTDTEGVVRIPSTLSGYYLVSAVMAQKSTRAQLLNTHALWQTHWASSTFTRY